MENLILERTPETPEINFNAQTGTLKLFGRAYSNDISFFYKSLASWLEEYLKSPQDLTTIELQLDYYNSIFIKLLYYFIEQSKSVLQKNKKLEIKWYYQDGDDESSDDAMRISKIINYPIETIPIE